jgi:uncharacterized membrane protein SpoIIM required for sporulation
MMIPILISLGFFAMIFGIVYMKTKENLAMLEKGFNPKEWANRPAPYKNLKWGLLLVGSGVGLLIAFFVDAFILVGRDVEPVGIYSALIGIGGGLGLIGSYRIEKKELLDKPSSVN